MSSTGNKTANNAQKKQKGFRSLNLKAKTISGRGGSVEDPNVIIEALKDE